MATPPHSHSTEQAVDDFARRLVARLDEDALDHAITERLRAARVRAVAARQIEPLPHMKINGATATLRGATSRWGNAIALFASAVVVAAIYWGGELQQEAYDQDVAEQDARMLTDELPPAAWVDPGFVEYIRSKSER